MGDIATKNIPALPCRTQSQLSSRPSREAMWTRLHRRRRNKHMRMGRRGHCRRRRRRPDQTRPRLTAHFASASVVVHDAGDDGAPRRERGEGKARFHSLLSPPPPPPPPTSVQPTAALPACLPATATPHRHQDYVARPLHSGCHSLVNGPTRVS